MRLSIFLAVIAARASVTSTTASDGLTVKTPSGIVVGHSVGGNIREFLGIPYAQPPIGHLRFAPPAPLKPWIEPLNASNFSPSCYITSFAGVERLNLPVTPPPPEVESEDCLYLNIWTPPSKANCSKSPKGAAVMVYIPGGGWTLESSSTPRYNGTNLVLGGSSDIIVVNLNYRLNVFGYPGKTSALRSNQQNLGHLDAFAALNWVRNNIAAFGGDPKRITLFGESAGGSMTDSYLYSLDPKKDTIPAGVIVQSGVFQLAVVPDLLPVGEPTAETRWPILANLLGCHPDDIACFRAVPAAKLRGVVATNNLTFQPQVDDGTLFHDQFERREKGKFAKVPMLIGSNDGEAVGDKALTKLIWDRPTAMEAEGHRKWVKETWQYRYMGAWFGSPPGAFHQAELGEVFGVGDFSNPMYKASSDFIIKAWTSFARNPKNGLKKLGWPTFNPKKKTLILLADENVPGATFADPDVYQGNFYSK